MPNGEEDWSLGAELFQRNVGQEKLSRNIKVYLTPTKQLNYGTKLIMARKLF